MKINLGNKILSLNIFLEPNTKKLTMDLEHYFNQHEIDGRQIKKFGLSKVPSGFNIIPKEPYFEGCLSEGKYQKDLREIGEKFGIERLGFVYWCYPK